MTVVPAPARLSICGTTKDSADRLDHWLLRTLEFADEVVLLVDDTSTDETLEIARSYADVVHVYEHAPFIERAMDWCLRRASGDWLLWLDDDELLHTDFRAAIEDVLADKRLTHAYLPSRAVVRTTGGYGWLRQFPWYPDWRLRLVRNVGSIFRHTGRLHSPIEVHGDGVTLDAGETSIYHFDLALRDRGAREAKVERYRGNGAPSCEEYYLYEDYTDSDAVVTLDASAVVRPPTPAACEEGRRRKARPALEVGQSLTLDAMQVHLAALTPRAALFGADYLHHGFPAALQTNRGQTGTVTLRNASPVPWRNSGAEPGWVSLRYHWRHPEHGMVLREGDHSLLPDAVAPGATVTLPVGIWTPFDPGSYTLELDLRAEGIGWFSEHGVAPLAVPIEIRAAATTNPQARTAARLPRAGTGTIAGGARPSLTRRLRAIRHPLRGELHARNVVPIPPVRVLDTRDGSGAPGAALGPLDAGSSLTVELNEPLGIPGHAVGVIGNLSVPTATYNGYVSTSPAEDQGGADGFVSLYFNDRGEPTVNQVTMMLGPAGAVGGRVALRLSDNHPGSAHLLLDVVAYVS